MSLKFEIDSGMPKSTLPMPDMTAEARSILEANGAMKIAPVVANMEKVSALTVLVLANIGLGGPQDSTVTGEVRGSSAK